MSVHSGSAETTTGAADLPLAGVRVLDLSRALSGPFCTALLGDLGADVVKVESLDGEVCRQWGPWQKSESLYYVAANRNKRSLSIDMWSDEGKSVLRSMAPHFDVLVENFRPGVLAALGLDQAWIDEHCPELVVSSISGFGHVGPRRNEACFDQIALGMGGLMSIIGSQESGPMRAGIPLADTLTGMFAAVGICASLAAGHRSGRTVHTSLLESVIGVLSFQGQRYLSVDEVPELMGNDHPITVPYGVFATADSPINLAAATTQQWISLCEVLGAGHLAVDERFASPRDRHENKAALVAEIEDRLVERPSAAWLAAFKAAHIPSGPINDIAATFAEPQVQALGIVQEVQHPALGPLATARGPLWIDGRPTDVRRAAPLLGQHSVEVLLECGFSQDAVDGLCGRGVVATSREHTTV